MINRILFVLFIPLSCLIFFLIRHRIYETKHLVSENEAFEYENWSGLRIFPG